MTDSRRPDLDDLEAKARAATPGPWRQGHVERSHVFCPASHVDRMADERNLLRLNPHFPYEADAAFIAAANPTAVLWMVERIRQLEEIASCSVCGALPTQALYCGACFPDGGE